MRNRLPLAIYSYYNSSMSTINPSKKRVGRPRVDSEQVNVRLQRPILNSVDEWATHHKVPRPKAIKHLIEEGLIKWLALPLPYNPSAQDTFVQEYMREAQSLLAKMIVEWTQQKFHVLVPSPTLRAFFDTEIELKSFATKLGCDVRSHLHTQPDGSTMETQIFSKHEQV